MNGFTQAVAWLNRLIGVGVGLCILVVVGLISHEIVMRTVWNAPSPWGDEINTYLTGLACALGGGYTLLRRGHVAVDLLYLKLGQRSRSGCDVFAFTCLSIYCLTLIWFGWDYALVSFQTGETTGTLWSPQVWPLKAAIPAGASLLLLQGLANLIEDMASRKRSSAAGDRAA